MNFQRLTWASLILLTSVSTVAAQTEAEIAEAFAGTWEIVDSMYAANDGPCAVQLSAQAAEGIYGASTANCSFEISAVSGWRVVEGQLELVAGQNSVAFLGGHQLRMSGDTVIGAPIILDRVQEPRVVNAAVAAAEATGCYYLGFTSVCADEAQLKKPEMSADGTPASISVLVNLNARFDARDDAEVLGVVPAGSCIVTDICSDSADGVWCRAAFDNQQGWLKKVALRQQTWPVITFVNQCATAKTE